MQPKHTEKFYTIDIPKDNNNSPLIMEQVLSVIHGMKERVSFEVWASRGKIQFGFWTPKTFQSIKYLFESHYPGIEVKESPDFASKLENKQVSAINLELEESDVYPIKRYSIIADRVEKSWGDPYTTILSAMAGLKNGQLRGIQIIFQNTLWQQKGYDLLRINDFLSFWPFSRFWGLKSSAMKVLGKYWIFRMLLLIVSPKKQSILPAARIDYHNHDKESTSDACFSKLAQIGFKVSIRIIYAGNSKYKCEALQNISSSFSQFNISGLNSFCSGKIKERGNFKNITRRQFKISFFLSLEELAGLIALPTTKVKISELKRTSFTSLRAEGSIKGILIGRTIENKPVMLEKLEHMAVFGKTGVGKSTLMFNVLRKLINTGKGLALLDPHGDLLSGIINAIPKNRVKDTVLIDPADSEYPIAFNVLHPTSGQNDQVVSAVVDTFKKLFLDSWGPRTDYILSHAVSALVSCPNTSLLHVQKILLDESYRKNCLKQINNPLILEFWHREFKKMPARLRAESISPILNKINRFLMVPMIRNILGQTSNLINFRNIIDSGKILLINLSKGLLGEENSALLGNFLLSHMQLAALSRADIPHGKRVPFTVFVDELQHFTKSTTGHISTILSEGRKYRINLIAACQFLGQMHEISDTLFGNINTFIGYAISYQDAQTITPYLRDITPDDLINLPKYHAYLRTIKDNKPHIVSFKNFLAEKSESKFYKDKIVKFSRKHYSRSKKIVEDEIAQIFHHTFPIP